MVSNAHVHQLTVSQGIAKRTIFVSTGSEYEDLSSTAQPKIPLSDPNNPTRSMVIYMSVGFVIALALLSSAAFFFWCYRKKRQREANRFV